MHSLSNIIKDGMTPLMFAVSGHVRRDGSPAMYERLAQLLETVRLLVEKGADLNIQTKVTLHS